MKKRYPLFLVLIFLLFDIDTRNFRKFATVNCKKKLQQEKKKIQRVLEMQWSVPLLC